MIVPNYNPLIVSSYTSFHFIPEDNNLLSVLSSVWEVVSSTDLLFNKYVFNKYGIMFFYTLCLCGHYMNGKEDKATISTDFLQISKGDRNIMN